MFFKAFFSYWSRMQKRERLVCGAGLLCLVLLFFYYLLFPFFEAKEKTARSIQKQEKTLQELAVLKAQYETLKGGTEAMGKVMTKRIPDFTMASHLDAAINEAGMKSSIQDFQSTKLPAMGGYHLIRTEIKIAAVTSEQLVKFLYLAESPENGVRIEQIAIMKNPKEAQFLGATVVLKTYEKTASG